MTVLAETKTNQNKPINLKNLKPKDICLNLCYNTVISQLYAYTV